MIPSLPLIRSVTASVLAGCAALLMAGCAAKPKYRSVSYQDEKLATPPHNLSPAEYPFDDDGTYRKDWVANPSSAKRSSRRRSSPASPTLAASSPPERLPSPAPTASASVPPPSAAYPASRPAAPAPTPPPAPRTEPPPPPRSSPPAPAAARYHTVVKGDTLYSISRRYGVTVAKLKSVNGLRSDTIRIGQTLRVP